MHSARRADTLVLCRNVIILCFEIVCRIELRSLRGNSRYLVAVYRHTVGPRMACDAFSSVSISAMMPMMRVARSRRRS